MKTLFSIAVVSMLLLISCNGMQPLLTGSGVVKIDTRDVKDFTKVRVKGIGDLKLHQGDKFSVRVEADDNFLSLISTKIVNDTLEIEPSWNLSPKTPIQYFVEAPAFTEIIIEGSSNFSDDTEITGANLKVVINGSSEGNLRMKVDALDASIEGSGTLIFSGSASDLNIVVGGSGDCDALKLATYNTRVEIDGSGDVAVQAKNKLDITLNGSGTVRYKGSPVVTSHITGSGSILRLE